MLLCNNINDNLTLWFLIRTCFLNILSRRTLCGQNQKQ